MTPQAPPTARPWLMLTLGLLAAAASSAFLYGLPFLVPALRRADGLSLATAGVLVALPSLGLVTTLVAWGAFVDRYGERLGMGLGLGLSGGLLLLAQATHDTAVLGLVFWLAGAASGAVNAASGRVVMGWFDARQRGLAMGARQMAQPLGVALAALVLPSVASAAGVRTALLVPAALSLLVALVVALLVVDPPRSRGVAGLAGPSPYRKPALWRLHASSALLVVPQFAVSVFSEEYLVAVRHWTPGGAGRILAVVQLAGALGRLVVGRWSDHAGSRLGPMRKIAVASALAMLAVGATAATGSGLVLLALAAATVISITDNGLGFTATAELAGTAWSGRALGLQNTAQNLVGFATPALFAVLVGQVDYSGAFLACALFPAIGIWTTPVRAEEAGRAAVDLAPDEAGRAAADLASEEAGRAAADRAPDEAGRAAPTSTSPPSAP